MHLLRVEDDGAQNQHQAQKCEQDCPALRSLLLRRERERLEDLQTAREFQWIAELQNSWPLSTDFSKKER